MSGCGDVCLDMNYAEENQFYSATTPTARKEHYCCECDRGIGPGETYEKAVGRSDGRFWTNKTCAECLEVRTALVCGTWVFGQLWEAIRDDVFPVWVRRSPLDCLAKVDSKAARDKLTAAFAVWQEEMAA